MVVEAREGHFTARSPRMWFGVISLDCVFDCLQEISILGQTYYTFFGFDDFLDLFRFYPLFTTFSIKIKKLNKIKKIDDAIVLGCICHGTNQNPAGS